MKILFILELYYPNIGGIEKLFKELAESLVQEGHSVTVITSKFRKDLPSREIIGGVKIKRLNMRSRFLFTFFGLFGMLKETWQCDLVHTTSYNAAFPARIAAWIFKKKVIITFHEAWGRLWFRLPYAGWLSKWLYYIYEWMILRMGFHRYIAVSDYTAACLADMGVPETRIVRIYNGLDYREYKGGKHAPSANFTFTYFGRLGISKGMDLILIAAREFLIKYPDAHLKMIIPRTPKKLLNTIMGGLSSLSSTNYTLLHELSFEQLKDQLISSSCIIIPSYSEGFCFAAAETAAMGIPIVSSGQGALREVVSGKYITMPTQDENGLLSALERAYRSEWDKKPLRKFEFADTLEKYLKLYEEE